MTFIRVDYEIVLYVLAHVVSGQPLKTMLNMKHKQCMPKGRQQRDVDAGAVPYE